MLYEVMLFPKESFFDHPCPLRVSRHGTAEQHDSHAAKASLQRFRVAAKTPQLLWVKSPVHQGNFSDSRIITCNPCD